MVPFCGTSFGEAARTSGHFVNCPMASAAKRHCLCPTNRVVGGVVPAMVNALPMELLALIFEHTPFRARMRTLSFVCKRWRTAALRSVTWLPSTPKLDCIALALYPSLTHLEAPWDRLRSWAAQEECGERTPLSMDLNLRALTINAITEPLSPPPPRIAMFLRHHMAHLTELDIWGRDLTELVPELSRIGMPEVRVLSVNAISARSVATLVQAAPRLTALTLRICSWAPRLLDVPVTMLTSLKTLHLSCPANHYILHEPAVDYLLKLPRLASLKHNLDLRLPPCLQHMQTSVHLNAECDWPSLAHHSNLTALQLSKDWTGSITPLTLPFLSSVWISPGTPVCRTTELASAILHQHRGLEWLSVSLQCAPPEALEKLVAQGIRYGLRRLLVSPLPEELPRAAKAGWIRLDPA